MDNRIKIFYLITSTNVGGTERALHQLVRGLDGGTFATAVCSVKKPGSFAERIAAEADVFYSLGLSESGGVRAVLNFLPACYRLVRLLRTWRPHIVHSFLFRANLMGRFAARIAGAGYVISSIRVIEPGRPYKNILDRMTSGLVDRYMAVSEAARKYTIEHVRVASENIITVYNGVDMKRFCTVRKKTTLTDGKTAIGLIGRFDKQKGHAILLESLGYLLSERRDIHVYLFGEGPDEAAVREQAERFGVDEHVSFMGARSDIEEWIAAMHIIVIPSLWEGLPNAALEAMALCRPVVAARIPGVDEIVIDGTTGLLFPPGDARRLAECLRTFIISREKAEDMGRRGCERVKEYFSLEKTIKKTAALYTELTASEGCHHV